MELLKRPVRTYRTIEIRQTEELFENSIIVPDSKPDVGAVLVSDAECFVTGVEKSGRMVEVSGEIKYRILYCSDTPDRRPESIVARFPWSVSCPKPKTEGEIGVFARCRCQHTEANAVNGRKIVARTVTALLLRFYEIKSDELGREISGENVFLKTNTVNIVSLKDNANAVSKVSNTLALPNGSPAIKEILYSRVNLGSPEVNSREEEPEVEAKGTLYLLYQGDNMENSLETVVLEFPVKLDPNVNAGNDGSLFMSTGLKSWDIDILEDNDGLNTQVAVVLEVETDTQAMVNEEETVIDDAYSLDYVLTLNKASKSLVTDERELADNHEARGRIRLDTDNARLEEVLMVCASERGLTTRLNENKVEAQGTVGVDIVFICQGENRELKSQMTELPLAHSFNLPENGNWQVVEACFYIDDVNFDISGSDSVEASIKLKLKLRVARTEEVLSTDSLIPNKDDNSTKRAPITLYFSQPNDSLWSIAKHYRIPPGRLAQENGLEADVRLEAGKRLFVVG